jgi:NAD-dependent deacetylase
MLDSRSDSARLVACRDWLRAVWNGRGLVLALTGAGVSAESGIPTFRGEEGYWRIGSRNYFPEELATRAAFERMPREIWSWYLYRRGVCRAAAPNAAHLALSQLDRAFATSATNDFLLVTQNVDGLHLRAGNAPERTYQIHGNIDFMRSVHDHASHCYPLPDTLDIAWERDRLLTPAEHAALVCPDGAAARPHVLWFDESYDEERYRFRSTLDAVECASLVIVIGTAGATYLPSLIVERSVERGTPMLVINRDPSPFTAAAEQADAGHFLQGVAATLVPRVVDIVRSLAGA